MTMSNVWVEYIFTPATLISIVSSIVWAAVAWTSMKSKVDQLEKDVKELQSFHLDVEVAEMKKDIQYIREMLDRIFQWMKIN